ncbi:MAG: hypothetical protein Q7U54_00615 [Bacteroidales bacterium]|nr:hypothetical protein [Bacteroidales bacterium]
MSQKLKILFALFFLLPFLPKAQKSSEYLPDKPGKWVLNTYSFTSGDAFHQNVKTLAEWFHQKVPIMANPKGFDLEVDLSGYWNDKYSLQPCNYGRRGELNFNFQLFSSKGGKWTVEPPHWSFEINNTEEGHPRLTQYVDFDNTKDPPSLEKPLNKAAADLNDLFIIFPFKREIAPGVRLYGPNLIVFNPDRPPFWIPVTVREVAEMKVAYYSLIEVHLLPYLKEEIAKLTEDELNAFAYSGNEKLFALGVHPEMEDKDKEEGGKIMRFNPGYWDRSLPPTAIQIMSFYYPERSQAETDDFFKYNGYPIFGDVIMNSIKPEDLAGLIIKKK